jgi:diacylglycerol kinase
MKLRLIAALASYAMLALLAALTLQGKFRIAVWILLAGLACKTWIAAKMQKHSD